MRKFWFLKDWGWVNFFYFIPASLLIPIWGFLQPPTGAISLDEIWLSLIFYSNLYFPLCMGIRQWALKRKSVKKQVFAVPLSFGAGALLYLFPFAVLGSLILVETQGEQLLKIPQNPGIFASIPFLTLCFFFALPFLWGAMLCLSWLVCWGWRVSRSLSRKLAQERLHNAQKQSFKDPLLASWVAVNIFYLLPASLALPFLIFTYSNDPDAFFILLMAWLLLLVIGNIVGGAVALWRCFLLKKHNYADFQKIILSPIQSNCLYIMPLVIAGSLEAALTSWGKIMLQMDLETFFAEVPLYFSFFCLDLLGFWFLASCFSWLVRALATLFWQPDPRPSALKGKRQQIRREMPVFLIHLPKSMTGNLLEEMEAEPQKTQIDFQALSAENRPAAGPLFLYHWCVPQRVKALVYAFCREMGFYIFPLALAWGIGTVFVLETGAFQDFFQMILWAGTIAFLLGLVAQVYVFLCSKMWQGILFTFKRTDTPQKKSSFLSFLGNLFRYILPAPCLIGFLATVPEFFTPQPIAPFSALMGAVAVVGMAICLSLFFQGCFSLFRVIFYHFFGGALRRYQQNLAQRKTEKQALKQSAYKWQVHKYRFKKKLSAPQEDKNVQKVKKRKISKIVRYDGRVIRIRPSSRPSRKR
ncbi:hypothetical protein FAI41_03560 [Acetobacteraceae bacterium]|nr:hypothetical protein FAI41_03560 [Acetobacteraceae bacterium]